ncbi:site-2 protease family protein [Candidatus Fermentibacteria bacterium]|nr:site-2 protease family protein [Candidatus Fermentibacteria bacterium]
MFGKRMKLFKLLGFEVGVDQSWLILAVLITWSLATGVFPHYFEGFSTATYIWMAIIGAVGFFASIIFHELCHSLVARRFGLRIKGITLFIFGGVAQMEEEPPSAKAEFMMAIAGPLSSIALGVGFYGISLVAADPASTQPVTAVLAYLAFINLLLAGFNLLPAFPLDGGRVLRSLLWRWKKNLRWATHISSQIGSGFGVVLIVLGLLSVITGNFFGGIWWFVIGMFLRGASQQSYHQLLMRRALEGEAVRRFMSSDPVTVTRGITVEDLVEDYIYKYQYKMYPVVEDGRLVGCVTLNQVKKVPREERASRSVGDIADACTAANTVHPDFDAMKALATMSRTGSSRLMVVDGDRLVGVVALKDMLKFLSLKIDLEEE